MLTNFLKNWIADNVGTVAKGLGLTKDNVKMQADDKVFKATITFNNGTEYVYYISPGEDENGQVVFIDRIDGKGATKECRTKSQMIDFLTNDINTGLVAEATEILEKHGYRVLNEDADEPASSRQLWALFCIYKKDFRNQGLTKGEASELIKKGSSERPAKSSGKSLDAKICEHIETVLKPKLDKKMELYMTGEDTELDRTVVDEIGDPLMHLLRNSADHGIENDEQLRIQRGKPAAGSIHLDAYQDGNNVVIEVRDDGNGIDVQKVKEKAIERGTITEEQAAVMTDKEIINLLFLPSFSTAKTISDVSGRGVGLDVVKSKIESLSGEVEVKSVLGEGSTWTIRLPLTLAIIQSLMVVVGGEKYAVPLGNIQTLENIAPSEVKFVQQKEVINLRGSVIPLIRLNEVLGCESTKSPEDELIVVIVKKGDKQAGLVIDELTGQQEIVIKSLGKYINKSKVISGATILGNGEVALIVDPNALI